MHLQENTLFDLDLRVKVIRNVAQCPHHHVTNASTKFEVTKSSMKYIMKTQDYDYDSYFVNFRKYESVDFTGEIYGPGVDITV